MTFKLATGIGLWMAAASAAVAGQQPGTSTRTAIVRTDVSGGVASSRRLEIRTADARGEVLTEIIETADIDGRFTPSAETVTEIVRSPSGAVLVNRELFGFDLEHRRVLVEATRSDETTVPGGTTTIVENTWVPDINGRLTLTARQIHHIQSTSAGIRETDTDVMVPGINEPLQQSAAVRRTERQAGSDVVRRDSTLFVRDVNGRLQPTEMRNQEVRSVGSDYVEEESVRRLDVNGDLVLAEKNVTRRSQVNGEDRTVVETFSRSAAGLIESGHSIRLVRRTVETTRRLDAARWQRDIQVFDVDVNGRLVLTARESEQHAQQSP